MTEDEVIEEKCHTYKFSLKAEERMKYFCNFECGIILHEKADVRFLLV